MNWIEIIIVVFGILVIGTGALWLLLLASVVIYSGVLGDIAKNIGRVLTMGRGL